MVMESIALREMNRRRFLQDAGKALAVGATLMAFPGCASSTTTSGGKVVRSQVATQLNWIKNVEFAGWFIADDQNFYQQEGIQTPDFYPGANLDPETVVAGGGADIGVSSFTSRFIDAVIAGADLVIFGVQYQINPIGFLSLASHPVRKPQDLVGKRIGIQTGSEQDIITILKLNGLPTNFNEVKVGYDPDPLVRGDVDVYYAFAINQPLTLTLKGIDNVFVSLADFGFPQYANVVFAKRSFIKDNRETIVRYLRATIKGWEKNEADPNLAVQLVVNKYGAALGLDPKQQSLENKAQIPLIRTDLTTKMGLFSFSKDEMAGPIYKALSAAGRSNLPSIDSITDLSILKDAYGGRTKLLG